MRSARFEAADGDCPLCHKLVPGGSSLRSLAKHFQACPVLDART